MGRWLLSRPPLPYETTRETYVNLCLGIAQGSFFSLDKSELTPQQELGFLGYWLDTVNETISVPIEKYNATVDLIFEFISSSQQKQAINIKTLQRIRVCISPIYDNNYDNFKGKLNSWGVVILNVQLYCRSMNQIIAVADAGDLSLVSFDHDQVEFDDLMEEFDYWTHLHNRYLVRTWADGKHNILVHKADVVIHTDASSSQMGSHMIQIDHMTALTTRPDVRVFRYTPTMSGWRIHRKVCFD